MPRTSPLWAGPAYITHVSALAPSMYSEESSTPDSSSAPQRDHLLIDASAIHVSALARRSLVSSTRLCRYQQHQFGPSSAAPLTAPLLAVRPSPYPSIVLWGCTCTTATLPNEATASVYLSSLSHDPPSSLSFFPFSSRKGRRRIPPPSPPR